MHYLNHLQFIDRVNFLGKEKTPFLFVVNFKGDKALALEINEIEKYGISAFFEGRELGKRPEIDKYNGNDLIEFTKKVVPFEIYKEGFNNVMKRIEYGDSYLLNLTYPTQIEGDINLEKLYINAKSKFKLLMRENFLFYSPEPFLKIENDKVYSFPMKGTISAKEENAKERLLTNKKELFEHYTIVDLIRNDLAMIAKNIEVEEFRYVESIYSKGGEILQTSSRITGELPQNWNENLGNIITTLLPAGSISGAPKQKTLEIINNVEISQRGFYTGVSGFYDGSSLSSCVMIRFIEKDEQGRFFYHSGGGITALSNVEDEYKELISKIYVPTV